MINRERLLEYCGGDESIARKFLAMFCTEAREAIELMSQHLESGSWEDLSLLSHKIKSHCRYVGADQAAETALHIEQQAGTAGKEEIATQISNLNSQLIAILDFIENDQ